MKHYRQYKVSTTSKQQVALKQDNGTQKHPSQAGQLLYHLQ
jgi:hypothetical protein